MNFPEEIALFILEHLQPADLRVVILTSKTWSFAHLAQRDHFWKEHYYNTLEEPVPKNNGVILSGEINSIRETASSRYTALVTRYQSVTSDFRQQLCSFLKQRAQIVSNAEAAVDRVIQKHRSKQYIGAQRLLDLAKESLDTRFNWRSMLRVVFVGDSGVGKSEFVITYVHGSFAPHPTTTFMDSYSIEKRMFGREITLTFCDTCGAEAYDRLRPMAYFEKDVFAICFSLLDMQSFRNVTYQWIPEVIHHQPDVPIVLIGTKLDRLDYEDVSPEERVTHDAAEKVAQWYGLVAYVAPSARARGSVDEAVSVIALAAIYNKQYRDKSKQCSIQ